MAQNKSNKIEYWKIGTGFLNYYKVILYWLGNQDFLDMKNNKSNYESNYKIIKDVISLDNNKKEGKKIKAYFNGNKNIKLYETNFQNINKDENIENIYKDGTLSQFINFLEFFDIYKNSNNSCLNISKNFINNVINGVIKDNSNVEKILSNYINNVLISQIEKKINSINNFDSNIKKYNCELTKKDNQIIDSITIEIAKNKFKPGSVYYDTNFNYSGIVKKSVTIKNDNNIFENIEKSNWFFSLIEKIEDNIDEKDFNNLMNIVKEYIKVLSLNNNWYLECVPILEFKTKENDSLKKVKIFEDEEDEVEKSNKTQNQNLEISKIGNSFLTNMYTLLIERTNANNKLFLPIFQRDYVWNESIVSNFLSSLFDDIQNKKKSYLNNIIFFDNIINKSSGGEIQCNIIDGQQRIFTTWLILLCLYKIYAYKNKIKIEELSKYFDDSSTIKKIFIKDSTNTNKNSSENIESYTNFYNILELKKNCDKNNNIWNLLLSIINNILKFDEKQREDFPNHEDDWTIKIIEQILFNTYVTQTHLEEKNFIENKVFKNLNQNVKVLNALDLLKNEVIDLCSLDKNINMPSNTDKINKIKEVISSYIKIIQPFYNDKNLIINKDLENFSSILFFREIKNDPKIPLDKYDFNMLIFSRLKHCIKKWFNKNKDIEESLEEFRDSINKYLLLKFPVTDYKINNFNFKFNGLLCQIYGITSAGSLTVTYPIIWSLLDKFKIWDILKDNSTISNDKLNKITEISQWFHELEKFIVIWKISYFRGDSLTNKFFDISENITNSDQDKNKYSIDDFRSALLKIKEIINTQDANEKFKKDLNEILINNIKNNSKDDLVNKMKTLFLIRINFYLENNFSLIITNTDKKGSRTYNESDITYEHFLPTIKKNNEDILDNEHNYLKNTMFLGNGNLLTKSQNSETNNNDIWEKFEKYNNGKFGESTIYKGIENKNNGKKLNPLCTNKIKELIVEMNNNEKDKSENWKIKEKEIKQSIYDKFVENIEERTKQMIDILCEMYKYDDSESIEEKNTNE